MARLLATQLPDGYLGTYAPEATFVAAPENAPSATPHDDMDAPRTPKRRGGWDVWTHRYNLYGLLTYESIFPDERVVDGCRRMADLLIDVYGPDGADLTKYGTRKGISATTLLESIVMLHERTGESKYLDFAEHIVGRMEANPDLKLMGTLLRGGSVVGPGEGKGYQLMANLLGFLRLYRCTGKREYLDTAVSGWRDIRDHHILVTGGPWTRHMDYNGNRECFARAGDFDPWEVSVEGCCDATWVQLCLQLFEVQGEGKYLDAAEVTLYNSLHGHQHADGIRWCYFTAPNEASTNYVDAMHCCGSSMPRAMEMFAGHPRRRDRRASLDLHVGTEHGSLERGARRRRGGRRGRLPGKSDDKDPFRAKEPPGPTPANSGCRPASRCEVFWSTEWTPRSHETSGGSMHCGVGGRAGMSSRSTLSTN